VLTNKLFFHNSINYAFFRMLRYGLMQFLKAIFNTYKLTLNSDVPNHYQLIHGPILVPFPFISFQL